MKTAHDLAGLMKFLAREEWRGDFQDVLDEHFGPVREAFNLEFEDVAEILEDWITTLWGCAFEDFITRTLEPDGRNIVDVYLKRRSWAEGVQSKAYMRSLRVSVMSLYEVSDVQPKTSFLARDLIRGGDPILVLEHSASQSLKAWDRIAARVLPSRDGHRLAGGLLPFSHEACSLLLEELRIAAGRRRKALMLDDGTLRKAAPLFTITWLFDVLPQALGEMQPVLHNSQGDEVVFHIARFPLGTGVTQKQVAEKLDGLPELHREGPKFWNWLELASGPKTSKAPRGLVWSVTIDDGAVVLGNVELKGRFVVLSVNSAARAVEGSKMLQRLLGHQIRTPLTEIKTVEQMRMSHDQGQSVQTELPPELAEEVIHKMLDRQYRAVLDEPVPMIGNQSPRMASRTSAGRQKVADWLKYLENQTASFSNRSDPMATYDFGWMWEELGVVDLRR